MSGFHTGCWQREGTFPSSCLHSWHALNTPNIKHHLWSTASCLFLVLESSCVCLLVPTCRHLTSNCLHLLLSHRFKLSLSQVMSNTKNFMLSRIQVLPAQVLTLSHYWYQVLTWAPGTDHANTLHESDFSKYRWLFRQFGVFWGALLMPIIVLSMDSFTLPGNSFAAFSQSCELPLLPTGHWYTMCHVKGWSCPLRQMATPICSERCRFQHGKEVVLESMWQLIQLSLPCLLLWASVGVHSRSHLDQCILQSCFPHSFLFFCPSFLFLVPLSLFLSLFLFSCPSSHSPCFLSIVLLCLCQPLSLSTLHLPHPESTCKGCVHDFIYKLAAIS